VPDACYAKIYLGYNYQNQFKRGKQEMPTITLDGKEYDTESMSEEALAQVRSLQYVNNQLVELQMRAAAFQTARNGYALTLKGLLEKGESGDDDSADVSLPDELTFD